MSYRNDPEFNTNPSLSISVLMGHSFPACIFFCNFLGVLSIFNLLGHVLEAKKVDNLGPMHYSS